MFKRKVMKENFAQQEIILVTATSFSSRPFGEINERLQYEGQTPKEKMKSACRNGLLPYMLPEIFGHRSLNTKLYLWEMSGESLFIELKPGTVFEELEMAFSIDPHSFMALQKFS
jgi:hypothetical protein